MNVLSAWKESDGSWSWARLGATATLTVGCWSLIHVVLKTHAIPDVATLGGLSAFSIAPYGVNKAMTAFAKTGAQL